MLHRLQLSCDGITLQRLSRCGSLQMVQIRCGHVIAVRVIWMIQLDSGDSDD